jgi:RHH-type proline utilization regulon transcriptional repressor/proline dehydrogenase/delta 1-pyrroline-5-carboxylate dehydrogenase
VCGVIFTGSTDVAHLIDQTLAQRAVSETRDLPLIAETGGQNAMIVDSSALPEQVVQDAISSAFDSAGQRCSALRVLCLQTDIADKTLHMLRGAMRELKVGNPASLQTDVGPVIDADAQGQLLAHIETMRKTALDVFQLELDPSTAAGTFVAPTVIEISSLAELQREVFGPVLHVLRYRRDELPALVDAINVTGYGLTLGIHSRIDETINFISSRAHVGNIYVNRNIVGAVVGVQPFGGEGKSGTGPKAGGPLYIKRLQRHAQVNPGAHVVHEEPESDLPRKVLDSLLAWARTHGHAEIALQGDRYLHQSLLDTTIVLPGPTGERNILRFAARGEILCVANNVAALLNQLTAAFATGNQPVVLSSVAHLLPEGLPAIVKTAVTLVDPSSLASTAISAALVESGVHSTLRIALAARKGALVSIVETSASRPIPLWRLVAERALCVNTTAAGGNASLMAISA